MTIYHYLGLALIFAMFASFIAVLGGVNLWMTVLDRREKAAAKVVPDVAYRRAA